jgi:predicted ester cyclase
MEAWFEEVWNQGREETIERLLASSAKVHGLPSPDGQPLIGPKAFTPFFRSFRAAFPDIHVTIARSLTEGRSIAVHCQVAGTHSGAGLSFAPTFKPVNFWGMCIIRVEANQIQEGWNSFDFLTLYQQLGLLPSVSP